MKRKKEAIPQEPSAESPLEMRKVEILKDNKSILEDPIFERIVGSIEISWDKLDDDHKEKVLDAFAELLRAIKEYADSYRSVKGILKFKLSDEASAESRKRYQGEVKEKDERERQLHNVFLDAVNILSRRMGELGLDNSWRGDDKIYPQSGEGEGTRDINRQKVKRWMFRVFQES